MHKRSLRFVARYTVFQDDVNRANTADIVDGYKLR
jgi:hypothetical protein